MKSKIEKIRIPLSRIAAVASLGRMWCSLYIAGSKDKELITNGPYSLCRNT
jgi:hypothetical protein